MSLAGIYDIKQDCSYTKRGYRITSLYHAPSKNQLVLFFKNEEFEAQKVPDQRNRGGDDFGDIQPRLGADRERRRNKRRDKNNHSAVEKQSDRAHGKKNREIVKKACLADRRACLRGRIFYALALENPEFVPKITV